MDLNSSIFSSGPVSLFQWDASDACPILSVSPNIQQLIGYSAAELTAEKKRYAELIHPHDRDQVYAQVAEHLRAGEDEFDRLDYRLLRKDGSCVWVEDHTVVIRDHEDQPVKFIGYIIDVTERHNAEQDNLASKNRIEAITDLMSDWAWEVDQHGVYTYCSDRVKAFLGYSAAEIIGKTPFDLMPPDEAKRVTDIFTDLVKHRAPIHNLENWNLDKNGNLVCLLTNGIPLFSVTGEWIGYRGVDTDITTQKNNEQVLQRAHTAAIEALRSKNEFLANISHELRTPLNGINGALQLLEETRLSEEQESYISIASKSSQLLIELVNNLLNYASIQAGRFSIQKKPTAIRELIQSQHQVTSLLIKNNDIQLDLRIEDNVPAEVMTDPIWLNQVLCNLTNNAIKFTPRGKITTRVKFMEMPALLQIEIQDTGIGIAKDKCAKIFEPFYQVDSGTTRKYEGAGLGLAISKDVISHLGGDIGIESQSGKGTTIWFSLPLGQAV